MPNVTAFQKADRLALLVAIDSFFALVDSRTMSDDATKVAFTIRRRHYEGQPADVKTLASLLGFSKTKVLNHLKELEEFGFEFRTEKDENDARRSVQRLYGTETPETTAFFDKCLKVVDVLVEAREEAKKLIGQPDPIIAQKATALAGLVAAAKRSYPRRGRQWLVAWLVFDTDKVKDLGWLQTMMLDFIEDPDLRDFSRPLSAGSRHHCEVLVGGLPCVSLKTDRSENGPDS